jgi:hypothetical protein
MCRACVPFRPLVTTLALLTVGMCLTACGASGTDTVASDPVVGEVLGGAEDSRLETTDPIGFEGTGFFRTAFVEGRWWLVTPAGAPFYSVGICNANPRGYVDRVSDENPYAEAVAELYADDAAWAATTGDRLEDWGFNTLGAWSASWLFGERFPYTDILYITGSDWLVGDIPDYFSPEFEARCAAVAEEKAGPRVNDPLLIGYFLDNELRWGPDWRSDKTLLEDFLSLPEGAPGRAVAESFGDDERGFLAAAAERYFEVTTSAVRAVDPRHMILGIRSVSILTPPEVAEAAGRWLDVMSVNNYVFNASVPGALADLFGPFTDASEMLAAFADVTGLPIMITEFSFRAADSGLPNSFPPIYPTLATQEERADAFEAYVLEAYEKPWIVGHHWFEYVDEPPGGRFDGEDSNFGVVSGADEPWQVLTARMREIHALAPHRSRLDRDR